MFERFTDRSRRVIVLSQEESRLLNHHYIGTEHLLLGILHQDDLRELLPPDLTLENVRQQAIDIIGEGSSQPGGHIPFTPRSKMLLTASCREADKLQHRLVTPAHLMLGLLWFISEDAEAVAGRILRNLNINLEELVASLMVAAKAIRNDPLSEPEAEAERDISVEEELRVKGFIRWYRETGKNRFGTAHPVSKLYRHYTEQPDP